VTYRPVVESVFRETLEELDPGRLVESEVARTPMDGPVDVIAVGKAAPRMIEGALRALGGRARTALAVSDRETDVPGASIRVAAHPYPDGTSVAAGDALLSAARSSNGTLLVLVSGGASALAEVPPPGVDVAQLAQTQRVMMDAGISIGEMNTVRRQCSLIKNGGLLAASSAHEVVTLLLSDVAGEPAPTIGSGPTLADRSTPDDAVGVLVRYGLEDRVPPAVIRHLRSARPAPPTPVPHRWSVLAGPVELAETAARHLADRGVPARVVTTSLRGEARSEGPWFASMAGDGPAVVATGETTVRVAGAGLGGRNQEAALAASLAIQERPVWFAALATDGIDGPTDAAGAIVDGDTAARMREAGIDGDRSLADNDSYHALAAVDALVITGTTGTNLGDLWMAGQSSIGPGRRISGSPPVRSTTVEDVPPGHPPGR
jgi:glycerate 2-kinase